MVVSLGLWTLLDDQLAWATWDADLLVPGTPVLAAADLDLVD
jgi:hypothetical protein